MSDDDILIHELLLGRWDSDLEGSDPEGWYPRREYPDGDCKRAAHIALANAIRRRDEFALQIIADMIDPRTDSSIIRRKIEFVPVDDGRREPKISDRRIVEPVAWVREWQENHKGESLQEAVAAAAEHFDVAEGVIWDSWKRFKKWSTSGNR